ncbi:MAG TPA: carbamoyltransferase C-terminal domain-containing protein [Pirellulales bacterium]|nr:carbamoyltransferase C-terminal domain-containing protein [Pirellulales bacterium]
MGKFILGIHSIHNASACIGDETGILYAVQEERLVREKNYWGYPRQAIDACLKHVGARPQDICAIGYGGKQVFYRYHSRDDLLQSYARQNSYPGKLRQRLLMPLVLKWNPTWGQKSFENLLREQGLGDIPLAYYDHHRTHAATAYYGLRTGPDERLLVLTCDGAGDGLCASIRVMNGQTEELVATTAMEHSLGAVYSWTTYGMGFMPLEHEYKLMGMAPYASEKSSAEMADTFAKYVGLDETGLKFERRTSSSTNNINERLFGDLKGKRFDYICGGLQHFTEDLLARWAGNAVRTTGLGKVVGAGGVFMNVKANKRIGELAEVKSFEAFPSCGDETLSLGAYYLEAARIYGNAQVAPLRHFYLGDATPDQDCLAAIRASGLPYDQPANMADTVATLLISGNPVARCCGPMEFGARALGNRSILADPRNQDVVRVINQMVKKRDFWMPFAPMMKGSRQHDYLQNPKNLRSPYMMMTYDTKDNFRDFIAAVHNADLTCRAQILERDANPAMHDILDAFEAKTGCGVILNTSFNLHGFPIVRTPAEAIEVLQKSGLKYLQVGSYLVRKE